MPFALLFALQVADPPLPPATLYTPVWFPPPPPPAPPLQLAFILFDAASFPKTVAPPGLPLAPLFVPPLPPVPTE